MNKFLKNVKNVQLIGQTAYDFESLDFIMENYPNINSLRYLVH